MTIGLNPVFNGKQGLLEVRTGDIFQEPKSEELLLVLWLPMVLIAWAYSEDTKLLRGDEEFSKVFEDSFE